MEVATKTNEIGGYLITSWREEPEIYGGVGEPSHPPQVGHHPEPCAQHHHLQEEEWHPSTNSPTPKEQRERQSRGGVASTTGLQVSTSMEVSSSGRQPVCPKEVLKHSKAGLEDAGGEEEGSL